MWTNFVYNIERGEEGDGPGCGLEKLERDRDTITQWFKCGGGEERRGIWLEEGGEGRWRLLGIMVNLVLRIGGGGGEEEEEK